MATLIQANDLANSPGQLNILDNGGFEIWQRGSSFSAPANNAYTADRWDTDTTEAANVTVTQEASVFDSGLYSMKVVITSAGAAKLWDVIQYVENYQEYQGKTVSFSARVFSSVATACRISIDDGVTQTFSSYHTGGGGWETLTVTMTLSASASRFLMKIGMIQAGDKKNGTYYWDSAMLMIGSQPVNFVPANPALDYQRCRRFFQIYGNSSGSGNYLAQCFATSTTAFGLGAFGFITPMRVAPTCTVTSQTSFLLNDGTGNVAVVTLTVDGLELYGMRFNGTTAGSLTAFHGYSLAPQGGTLSFSADL